MSPSNFNNDNNKNVNNFTKNSYNTNAKDLRTLSLKAKYKINDHSNDRNYNINISDKIQS